MTNEEAAMSGERHVQQFTDDLRFGPLAFYMLGWTEEQRSMVVDALARDLISSGWIAEARQKPRCTDCTNCGCQK